MGLSGGGATWYVMLGGLNAALAGPIRDLADGLNLPVAIALLFGLLGATSPCQLAQATIPVIVVVRKALGPLMILLGLHLLGRLPLRLSVGWDLANWLEARAGSGARGSVPARDGVLARLLSNPLPALLRADNPAADNPARVDLADRNGLPWDLRPRHDAPVARPGWTPDARGRRDAWLPGRDALRRNLAVQTGGDRIGARRPERHHRLLAATGGSAMT